MSSMAARAVLTTNGNAASVAASTAAVFVNTSDEPVSDSYARPSALLRPTDSSR